VCHGHASDLLISTISRTMSGSHNYEVLLRVITEDECDDFPDDVPGVSLSIT
jgi:hypothetical protein